MEFLQEETKIRHWLRSTPTFTTFRINKLRNVDISHLNNFLKAQSKDLNMIQIPKYYFLKPDCLILEQWPENAYLINNTNKEVIVDALCAAAVLKGAHVFAPGVMGLPVDCQQGEQVNIYGDLEGHCKRGLKVTYEGRKLFVGTGYLKMLRSHLFDKGIQPSGIAVETILPMSRLPVVNESIFPKGDVLLQNLPSIVCGWVVNAQPYEHILDMCAAPGNKTTHLAEMSDNRALITAIDKTPQKVAKIKENCHIRNITCVNAFVFDSTRCCSEDNVDTDNGPPFRPNSFDKVLLDAPCSCLGQRPQLATNMTAKMMKSYKCVQKKLMIQAVKLLKPGGKLVYSTCTITDDENEGMVVWALEKFPCLKLIPAEPLLGGPGLPNKGLNDEQRIMVQRFGPEEDDLRPVDELYKNSIGFFIAAFEKIS